MTQISATHESGSKIVLARESGEVARTVELLKASGYVTVEVGR